MTLPWAALMLAVAGLLHAERAPRAGLLLSALIAGVAAAGLAAVVGHTDPARLARGAEAVASGGFLRGVLALLILAAGVALIGSRRWTTLFAVGLLGVLAWPLGALAGWIRPAGVAAAILAVAIPGGLVVRAVRPGRLWLALDRGLLDPGERGAWTPPLNWTPTAPVLALVVVAAVALAVPHLVTVLGGAVIAALVAWRLDRGRWVLLAAAVVLLLALVGSLHLAGPLGGWIPNLIDGPFSPRAERWLSLLAAVAVAALAGLWPLHGAALPVVLSPLAVAVGGHWAWRLLPAGVEFWQPLFAPIAVLAMAHAATRRRWPNLLVAGGVFGLWTGQGLGVLGGALLIAAGWLASVLPTTRLGRLPAPPALLRLAGLLPVGGALLVLRAGLATEITYTLLGVLIAAGAILRAGGSLHPWSESVARPA